MSFFPSSRSGKASSLPVSTCSTHSSKSKEDHHHHHHIDAASQGGGGGLLLLRKRISSSFNSSLNNNNNNEKKTSTWSSTMKFLPRSKSSSSALFSSWSMGDSIRNWWVWSWAWILSRKPIFATDLEMNEQETKLLASRDRGSWKHVLCRMRSEIRRIATANSSAPLPQTYTTKD